MNKKGFTFIEMLAIMSLIAAIVLFSSPAINNMLKQGEDDRYNQFKNTIFLASEAYLQKHINDFPTLKEDDGFAYIYLSDLVKEKYVKSTLVNPKYCVNDVCESKRIYNCYDENCVIDEYTIVVEKNDDKTFNYELIQGKITDQTRPTIEIVNVLNTSSTISISYNATDSDSSIKEVRCYYGLNDLKNYVIGENGICEITNLVSDKEYKYKVIATNSQGLSKKIYGSIYLN